MSDGAQQHYQPKAGPGEELCRKCGLPSPVKHICLDGVCLECHDPQGADGSSDETPESSCSRFDTVYIRAVLKRLSPEQLKTLRNRTEDQLRKSPLALTTAVTAMIKGGLIRYQDILDKVGHD